MEIIIFLYNYALDENNKSLSRTTILWRRKGKILTSFGRINDGHNVCNLHKIVKNIVSNIIHINITVKKDIIFILKS